MNYLSRLTLYKYRVTILDVITPSSAQNIFVVKKIQFEQEFRGSVLSKTV